MKTSVWCFIRADSCVMWIFKEHGHGPASSLFLSLSVPKEKHMQRGDGQRQKKKFPKALGHEGTWRAGL